MTDMAPRSVCLVISSPSLASKRVAAWAGHSVQVLFASTVRPIRKLALEMTKAGVSHSHLDPASLPEEYRCLELNGPSFADRSDQIRLALRALHQERSFDVIEFPLQGGLGLRSIQAKRAGLDFEDVAIVLHHDTHSRQVRETEERWPAGLDDLLVDHAEGESAVGSGQSANQWAVGSGQQAVNPQPLLSSLPTAHCPLPTGSTTPLVTIGIAHYNLAAYLDEALASIKNQTYLNLEVLIVDDGSTDVDSDRKLAELATKYPTFRFSGQANAGIGATRNRCLHEARGEFFIPMDADNIARPEMVERFVRGMLRNPDLSAMTCYYLAFADGAMAGDGNWLHACRPVGGPHIAASIRNVYGDANAIFRTADFRTIGGYETDRGTSSEDWEAFVKLVNAGRKIGVIPDHLFYYRQRAAGFSRATNWFANHQRVLRQFQNLDRLPPGEVPLLWASLLGFHQRLHQLELAHRHWRYRLVDRLHAIVVRPWGTLRRGIARVLRWGR